MEIIFFIFKKISFRGKIQDKIPSFPLEAYFYLFFNCWPHYYAKHALGKVSDIKYENLRFVTGKGKLVWIREG